jgi:hypothetical protein
MKRIISIVGLCLAAVFVLSAMAASSASAADLLARIAGGGSVAGVTFLSSATLPLLFTHSGKEIHCKHVTNHGLFLSPTLGNVLIRFLGCTAKEGLVAVNCNTPGAGSGEIHLSLETLFHLGLAHLNINTGRLPAVAILLGKTIIITCGTILKIEVRGNVIGALQRNGAAAPLNMPFEDVNLNFQQTANGLQHLRLILMPGTTELTTYDLESSFGLGFELASEVANALLDLFRLSNGNHVSLELIEP